MKGYIVDARSDVLLPAVLVDGVWEYDITREKVPVMHGRYFLSGHPIPVHPLEHPTAMLRPRADLAGWTKHAEPQNARVNISLLWLGDNLARVSVRSPGGIVLWGKDVEERWARTTVRYARRWAELRGFEVECVVERSALDTSGAALRHVVREFLKKRATFAGL